MHVTTLYLVDMSDHDGRQPQHEYHPFQDIFLGATTKEGGATSLFQLAQCFWEVMTIIIYFTIELLGSLDRVSDENLHMRDHSRDADPP